MNELTPLDKAKEAFLELLSTLDGDELLSFDTFVGAAIEKHGQIMKEACGEQEDGHEHHAGCSHGHDGHHGHSEGHGRSGGAKIYRLNKIIEDLRERLPVNAEAPSEAINIPDSDDFEGYTKDNVVHVDGFLYTEDDVDELCDAGKLSRNYCLKCGSKDTKPLNFISHSASVVQLQYLFQVLLRDRISNKVVLDVGSRLGAVLYAGYLFTDAKKLVGVEMNDFFCKLQKSIVQKHRLQDRIEIVHDNLLNCSSLLESADVVIMNNVFQFFCPIDIQRQLWTFLYTHLRHKKGTILITVPSLQDQLKDAGFNKPASKPKGKRRKVPAKPPGVVAAAAAAAAAAQDKENTPSEDLASSVGNWAGWLREIEVQATGHEFVEDITEDELEELKLIHMYEVI